MLLSSVTPGNTSSSAKRHNKKEKTLTSPVSASPQHLSDWARRTFFEGKNRSVETRRVPCAPLHEIVRDSRVRRIDYLSVDVEGAEEEVLRTVPFGQVEIDVISVEASTGTKPKNEAVRRLLHSHEFEHVASVPTWRGRLGDEVYLHKRVSHTAEGRERRKLWHAKFKKHFRNSGSVRLWWL